MDKLGVVAVANAPVVLVAAPFSVQQIRARRTIHSPIVNPQTVNGGYYPMPISVDHGF